MATVGGAAADVVDRARRLGDHGRAASAASASGTVTSLAVTAAEPNAARTSPALGVDDDRERADRDHHRVSGADLHEGLRGRRSASACTGRDELVRLERRPLHAEEELVERQGAHAADARELHLGALDEERRQRVAGRRGGAEVAAERAAVPDLRRADGARRLGERGQRAPRAARAIASVYVSPAPRRSRSPPPTSRGAPRARRG